MKRLAQLLFGLLVLAILACGGAKGDDPLALFDSRIVFVGATGTTNYSLYITPGGKRDSYSKLTDIGTNSRLVRISPNKTKVLWAEGTRLFAINSDGTDKVSFGTAVQTLNADWTSDNDTIVFEEYLTNKIKRVKVSASTVVENVLDAVREMSVHRKGLRMAFVPLGSTSVHYSNVDGTAMDSIKPEPAGSSISNPSLSQDLKHVFYVVLTPTASVNELVSYDLTTGVRTVVSGSKNMQSGWALASVIDTPFGISALTGPTSFSYTLHFFKDTGVVDVDTITGAAIARVVGDPSGNIGAIYSKGNGLFYTDTMSAPVNLAPGLDRAGYADWR